MATAGPNEPGTEDVPGAEVPTPEAADEKPEEATVAEGTPEPGEPAAGTPEPGEPAEGTPEVAAPTPAAPAKRPRAPRPGTPRAKASGGKRPTAPQSGSPAKGAPAREPAAPPPAVREAASAPGARAPRFAAWPDRAVVAASALVATDILLLVGVLVTGLVASAKQGPAGDRLGAAFVDGVGTGHGLVLVVAAALLAWAAESGAPGAVNAARVVLVVAVMFFVAVPLAAWGDVSFIHHSRQPVDGVVRSQVATWMAVTMVPTGVAGVVAWWVGSHPA